MPSPVRPVAVRPVISTRRQRLASGRQSGWIEDTTIADALLRAPSHGQRRILCHSVRRPPPTAVHCRHVCEDRVRAIQLHPLQPVEPACRAVPGTERCCQWRRCLGCHCRLSYIRFNQSSLHAELYQGLSDAVSGGDASGATVGSATSASTSRACMHSCSRD